MQTECTTIKSRPSEAQLELLKNLQEEIQQLGGDFYLSKPINKYSKQELSEEIEKAIDYKRELENNIQKVERIVGTHTVRKEELGMAFKMAMQVELTKGTKRVSQRVIKRTIQLYKSYQKIKAKVQALAEKGEFS